MAHTSRDPVYGSGKVFPIYLWPNMIVHPGARTRALYAWERELHWREGNFALRSTSEAQRRTEEAWDAMGWRSWEDTPTVELVSRSTTSYAACWGRRQVELNRNSPTERTFLALIHELVHARGFGRSWNQHTVGFVLCYLQAMHKLLKWNYQALAWQAIQRGLLPMGR